MQNVSGYYLKTLLIITVLGICLGCQTNTPETKDAAKYVDPCSTMKDSVTTISIFKEHKGRMPTEDFFTVLEFIESKGEMKLLKSKRQQITNSKHVSLSYPADTCGSQFFIRTHILKNIWVTTCVFKSIYPLTGGQGLYPGFVFSQWTFTNDRDRDSALKILNFAYANKRTIYEKKYYQTIAAEKRLFLIEPNAKVFEQTGVTYAKYLRKYIDSNNSR